MMNDRVNTQLSAALQAAGACRSAAAAPDVLRV